MNKLRRLANRLIAITLTASLLSCAGQTKEPSRTATTKPFSLTAKEYFSVPGADILAFNNAPGGLFSDAKTSGIEIIHHGERTVTNGDVRLRPTPEQWDLLAEMVSRTVNPETGTVTAVLRYPQYDFNYRVHTSTEDQTVVIRVELAEPLPAELVGLAGFNMEFLPSAYWDKAYLADGQAGQLPRSPATEHGTVRKHGYAAPEPIARARSLVLAPEDPKRRIALQAGQGTSDLALYDGRSKAQNGWYVVRSLLPAARTGQVLEWRLQVNALADWLRAPVIGFSQIGYHPNQHKVAVIELDPNDRARRSARLWRLEASGKRTLVLDEHPVLWGDYLRYKYQTFDFTNIREPGLYQLEYAGQTTSAFPIEAGVYAKAWQATLDYFYPVQMDHMKVKEAYRTWHGASHLDDALQAPANYEHFDLYAHGDATDTEFAPFEHIRGLNIGGWYDAGDFDIRTQSQYHTVLRLVQVFEEFKIARDNTTVSQAKRYVEINRPDGANDLLQQIEHGTLALIAQHRAVGHAIPGIVAGRLYQYPHLGDGSTKTDNRIYRKDMDPHADTRNPGALYEPSTVDPTPTEAVMDDDGHYSGRFDDRWAFTTNTSALNYGSAAALAAASRVLKGYNNELAEESLTTAERVWHYEADRTPNRYRFGNTTGGRLESEKLQAAVELLLATGKPVYKSSVSQLTAQLEPPVLADTLAGLVKALPLMDSSYRNRLENLALNYREKLTEFGSENPYGVLITRSGWAGNGAILDTGAGSYWLHKVFPEIIPEDWVLRSLRYIFGTHPDSNYSFVSAVGAQSQTNAYGNNRADFSFIPGGVVPGVLILQPDYPENKSDWPFFWGQNEYVIPVGAQYIFLVNAADALLNN